MDSALVGKAFPDGKIAQKHKNFAHIFVAPVAPIGDDRERLQPPLRSSLRGKAESS